MAKRKTLTPWITLAGAWACYAVSAYAFVVGCQLICPCVNCDDLPATSTRAQVYQAMVLGGLVVAVCLFVVHVVSWSKWWQMIVSLVIHAIAIPAAVIGTLSLAIALGHWHPC